MNKYSPLIVSASMLFAFSIPAYSQECTAHFEAEAGPDINVCEEGSVNLGAIMGGDATHALWHGGKGIFEPNRNALNAEYTPDTSEVGTTVVLTLAVDNPKFPNCPAVKSSIRITVNSVVVALAGNDVRICAGNTAQMHGAVTRGKAKRTTWITNGSGIFDNAHKLDALYTPSADDIEKGACSIMLLAEPFGVCLPDSNTMILMITPVPQVTLTPDIFSTAGKPVNVSAKITGASGEVLWNTSGTGTFDDTEKRDAIYTPSVADTQNGTVTLSVSVNSLSGKCSVKKQTKLHLNAQ